MKKSLIALAVLAASGAASAQSSVTLFGVVDLGVRYVDAGSNGAVWSLASGGYQQSRIGFRGTEDLGGGLSASFWLESVILADSGNGSISSTNNQLSGTGAPIPGSQGITFNRRSTVSLAGSWGELRLGRDHVPFFWNTANFDPFQANGIGSVVNLGIGALNILTGAQLNGTSWGARASNSIGYFLPNLGGFYGQAMYAMGENPSNTAISSNGNVGSVRLGYANGPINIAYAWGQTDFFLNAAKPSTSYQTQSVGASYNFGVAKLTGLWSQDKAVGKSSGVYLVGATVPLGAGEIRGSYSWGSTTAHALDGSQIALGYIYNLSRRTALYGDYSYIRNSGKLASYNLGVITPVGQNTYGVDFGVKHSF
jgi:predicted porin